MLLHLTFYIYLTWQGEIKGPTFRNQLHTINDGILSFRARFNKAFAPVRCKCDALYPKHMCCMYQTVTAG